MAAEYGLVPVVGDGAEGRGREGWTTMFQLSTPDKVSRKEAKGAKKEGTKKENQGRGIQGSVENYAEKGGQEEKRRR